MKIEKQTDEHQHAPSGARLPLGAEENSANAQVEARGARVGETIAATATLQRSARMNGAVPIAAARSRLPVSSSSCGDAAQIERRDAEERGEQPSAERGEAARHEPRNRRGGGRREQIAARGSDEPQHARRADRGEHRKPKNAGEEIEHHARRSGHRAEAHSREHHRERLQREGHRRSRNRNRDLRGQRHRGCESDHADDGELAIARCHGRLSRHDILSTLNATAFPPPRQSVASPV